MADSDSSGLKNLLSPQPDSNSNSNSMPNTNPMKPLVVSSTTPLASELIRNLEKASLESNASSSTISSPSSSSQPLQQLPMSVPSDIDVSLNPVEEGLGKEKEEAESKKDSGSSSNIERNHGKEKEENKNNRPMVINGKCYPPPISSLKTVMGGKPFRYLTYDKENNTYVAEEIYIPKGSLFHASREDGRLKLSMNFLGEEEEESQEEEEEEEEEGS